MENSVLQDQPKKERFSLVKYLKNSFVELKKVTWPTRDEALKSTGVVIIFTIIVIVILGLLDYLFNQLLQFALNYA